MSMYPHLSERSCTALTLAAQFPPDSISDKAIFSNSELTTKCPWKGTASYYNITVDGNVMKDAAWYYPNPKDGAKNIKDHIAFCEFQCFLDSKETAGPSEG